MGCGGSSTAMDSSFKSTSALDPNIVWGSRVVKTGNTVKFDWSGTHMTFGVTGNPAQVYVKIDGQQNIFNVYVDGQYQKSIYAKSGEKDYCVVDNLGRDATISLVKRTEAMNGIMSSTPAQVRSVGLPANCSVVKPSVTKPKKIEFIGDSDSAAFGNLAKRTPLSVGGMLAIDSKKQDVEKGWTGLVAKAFQADLECISISGTGAAWDSDGDADASMRKYYHRMLYSDKSTAATKLDPVDLVCIYLGGNDFEGKLKKDPSSGGAFVSGFAELLKTVRRFRPDTPIICFGAGESCGSALETKADQQAMSEICCKLIPQACASAGQNITFAKNEAVIDIDDYSLWGSLLHWSVTGHIIFARGAIDVISKHTGWQVAPGWENVPEERLIV
jgi:lysophospholipase L1-like esterase